MTFEQFSKHAQSLVGSSTDIYVKVIQPTELLIKMCFYCAAIPVSSDSKFTKILIEAMTADGDTFNDVIQWKNAVCPGLCTSIQEKIIDVFYERERVSNSKIC